MSRARAELAGRPAVNRPAGKGTAMVLIGIALGLLATAAGTAVVAERTLLQDAEAGTRGYY